MGRHIAQFTKACHECQVNKYGNQAPAGLLQSLSVPPHAWHSMGLDFVGPFPASRNGNDFLLVLIDRFSSRTFLHACTQNITADDVAHVVFRRWILECGRVPVSIVSDRDVRFAEDVWRRVWRRLGADVALSTTQHPQTDGATERKNRHTLEALRILAEQDPKSWDTHLEAIELGFNSTPGSSGFTPYQLSTGHQPRLVPDIFAAAESASDAHDIPHWQQRYTDDSHEAFETLVFARIRAEEYANKRRRDVDFSVGDEVLVDSCVLKLPHHRGATDGSSKLVPLRSGPFRITRQISPTVFEVDLQGTTRAHHRFHVSRLTPYIDSLRFWYPPEDSDGEHTVERILRKIYRRGRPYFLVKWQGYPDSHNIFVPEDAFPPPSRHLLDAFHQKLAQEEQAAADEARKRQQIELQQHQRRRDDAQHVRRRRGEADDDDDEYDPDMDNVFGDEVPAPRSRRARQPRVKRARLATLHSDDQDAAKPRWVTWDPTD